MNRRGPGFFAAACLAAAIVPFLETLPEPAATAGFPGWPAAFEGRAVRQTALTETEAAFGRAFPGRLARFTDGSRSIVMRWVTAPTHRVHAGADCLQAAGWRVEPGPVWRDGDGRLWSTWTAEKGGRRMAVRERCLDGQGGNWGDVSSWFWAATLGRTPGPWWVITVAEGR